MIRFSFVESKEIAPYEPQLKAFEREFSYAVGDQRLSVRHGRDYTAFFESIGDSVFLLVHKDEELIGCVALAKKKIALDDKEYEALYIGDLKVSKPFQMTGLATKIYLRLTSFIMRNPTFAQLSFVYFLAWQQNGADLTTIATRHSPLRLFSEQGLINIFFVHPTNLASLTYRSFHEDLPKKVVLNLSPEPLYSAGQLIDLDGKKELLNETTRLRLAHIALSTSTGSELIEGLCQAGLQAVKEQYELCCFALDTRRTKSLEYLKNKGINAESTAKLYAIVLNKKLKNKYAALVAATYQM